MLFLLCRASESSIIAPVVDWKLNLFRQGKARLLRHANQGMKAHTHIVGFFAVWQERAGMVAPGKGSGPEKALRRHPRKKITADRPLCLSAG
jgi:hypothetical protein